MNLLDLFLPFLLIGGILICFRRAFLRTLVSIFTLFIALIVAALLYTPLLKWFTSATSGGGPTNQNGGSVVFAGLLILFFVLLEYAVSHNYPNMRIAWLKNWDHILGGVIGVIWTALVISLILLILHYGSLTVGAAQVSGLAYSIEQSKVADVFRAFFSVPLSIIKLLFPNGLPEILKYFGHY
jgi:uncharacterized membrane protein required for colicin V production